MRKAVLYVVVEPKKEGQSPKMYWVKKHEFSTLREDAHIFTSKAEVDEVLAMFEDMDMQLEYLEG